MIMMSKKRFLKNISIFLVAVMAMTGFAFADVTDQTGAAGTQNNCAVAESADQTGAMEQDVQIDAFADDDDWGQGNPDPAVFDPPVLTAVAEYNNKAKLSWTFEIVPDCFELYRNGSLAGTIKGTQYTDTGLAAGAAYEYKVRARYTEDGDICYSDYSEPVTVTGVSRDPVLLMVDNRSDNKRVVTQFANVGVTVVTVYDINEVDPAKYDGLIIPGGGNMDPQVYHAKRDKHTYGTDKAKDELQIAAILRFADAGKPVLGICRGNQVINVAFGGTLKQHIPKWHKRYRKVKTVKGSWVRGIYGKKSKVYHWHHQCIKKLGSGLKVTARDAKDKRIEAIQHKTLPIYGVQWHPDIKPNKKSYKLYNSFKQICLNNMAK